MGIGDYIILAAVLAGICAAAVSMRRRKKNGKCVGCAGDCSSCAFSSGRVNTEKNK